ncbi:MFS transporter [Arthrobacter sp. I2-34]|uniref:MFS transporter n=1 Tax=Arthrobacter hankyongi TaxID=2904801 RepID=A0ABS9L3T4_9MICC|nr:MFS transporter [Arthrobacter hankyongi]MCG2621325.1 MFS transporter [Arthrobacter hankyongi]
MTRTGPIEEPLEEPLEERLDESVSGRSSTQLLFNSVFAPFFWGLSLATVGIWVHSMVAAIVAFQVSGSALVVGAVTVAQWLPQFLIAPLSGSLADRGDRRRQAFTGRLVCVAGSAGIAVWVLLVGADDPSTLPVLLLSAFTVGFGFAWGGPAMTSMVPALVRPEELPQAVSLYNIPGILARALGPILGAVLAVWVGSGEAFAFAAVSHLVFALALLRTPRDQRPAAEAGTDYSVRSGLRYVRGNRPVLVLLLSTAAISVASDPAMTLAPLLAAELGAGAGFAGVLSTCFGAGAMFGFVILAPLRKMLGPARMRQAGGILLAGGVLSLAVTGTPWLACAVLVLAGLGLTMAQTSYMTELYRRVPDAFRGRIMALWSMSLLGSRSIAGALNGVLAEYLSVAAALAAGSAALLYLVWLHSRLDQRS